MRVCVLGLGKSGIAVARHSIEAGDEVVIYAGAATPQIRAAAEPFIDEGVEVIFDTEEVVGHYDLCVACPGIPQTGAFYQSARAAADELISEPEYAWRLSPDRWISITGTNGKTTTTALTTHLLRAAGLPAFSCGNIGETMTEAVEHRRSGEILVAEMSSFQLASTVHFKPEIAVLLPITPDHLSWHGSYDAYVQAKMKGFANMDDRCTVVVCEEALDEALASDLRKRRIRLVRIGTPHTDDALFCEDGLLRARLDGVEEDICRIDDLRILGDHNIQDALCAAACALLEGASVDALGEGMRTFSALEHRFEAVDTEGDVSFYNDSKATNVDATIQALSAFDDQEVLLLLGGRDKGTDLAPLVTACESAPVTAVFVYGEAQERFAEAFADSTLRCVPCDGMREAFRAACEMSVPGQAVLLSPACASYDEFESFEERGSVFKDLVDGYRKSR